MKLELVLVLQGGFIQVAESLECSWILWFHSSTLEFVLNVLEYAWHFKILLFLLKKKNNWKLNVVKAVETLKAVFLCAWKSTESSPKMFLNFISCFFYQPWTCRFLERKVRKLMGERGDYKGWYYLPYNDKRVYLSRQIEDAVISDAGSGDV